MTTSRNKLSRRTKRADGRYIVNLTVEQLDGTKRRVYLYGRTREVAAPVCCEQLTRAEVTEPTVIALAQADQASSSFAGC